MINLEIVSPQGEEFKFLVDTGADRSCVSRLPKGCKLSKIKNCKVKGAKGKPFKASVKKMLWSGEIPEKGVVISCTCPN